jgi:hypothetical protein
MTWPETANFFDRLLLDTTCEFVKRGLAPDPTTITPQPPLEEYHEALEEEINQAVKDFSKNYLWPSTLSKPAMHRCWSRIRQARDLVRFLIQNAEKLPSNNPAINFDIPDDLLVTWLLTDYWRYAGRWREIFILSH